MIAQTPAERGGELIEAGKRLLAEQRPEAARNAFDKAAQWTWLDRETRELRNRAAREAEPATKMDDLARAFVDERLRAAEEWVAAGDRRRALELAELVLEADADNVLAREIAASARRALRPQPRRQPVAPPPPPAPAARAAPAPVAPEPAGLRIVFQTHIANGQVTISSGGRILLSREFDYPKRGALGISKKTKNKEGEAFSERLELPAGEFNLRLVVRLKGRKEDLQRNVGGLLAAGVTHTLRITVSEKFEVDVLLAEQ